MRWSSKIEEKCLALDPGRQGGLFGKASLRKREILESFQKGLSIWKDKEELTIDNAFLEYKGF